MTKTTRLKRTVLLSAIAAIAFSPYSVQAQEGTTVIDSVSTSTLPDSSTTTAAAAVAAGTDIAKKSDDDKNYKISLGIHAGTSGIGVQGSIKLAPFVSARLEGNYIGKKNYIFSKEEEGASIKNDLSITTGFIGIIGDFHVPVAKFISLSLGAVYDLTTVKLVQTFTHLSPEKDLGTLTLKSKINRINPYMGIMLGNPIPKRRVNVGLEMGTYYIGSPKVSWEGTGAVAPTADQSDIIEENIKNYSWIPVVSLHLNIKIN